MIAAIIGILLGLASYFLGTPFFVPILGAALGVYAIVQERRGEVRNMGQLIAGIAAVLIGVLATFLARIPTL